MTEKFHVLVVDDEEVIARNIKDYLKLQGLCADVCRSAEDALVHLPLHQHHVAILDVRLPGMNGHELCRCILREYPDVATIMLTAWPNDVWVQSLAREGLHDYLSKPAELPDIHRSVLRVLATRAGRQEEETRWLLNTLDATSHRFGNDMSQLRTMLELALQSEEGMPAATQEWVEEARAMAEKLADVVQGIADMAKGRREALSVEPRPLLPILKEVADAVRAKDKEVTLQVAEDVAPDLAVYCQAMALEWILRELILGATPATPGTPAEVRVCIRDGRALVSVRLSNSVAKTLRPLKHRIFKPYTDTLPTPEESSVVLASARLFAREAGGSMIIDQQGDEFWLVLRLRLYREGGGHE